MKWGAVFFVYLLFTLLTVARRTAEIWIVLIGAGILCLVIFLIGWFARSDKMISLSKRMGMKIAITGGIAIIAMMTW